VLAACHSDEFIDRAPATITATLADWGVYLCSTRTMYRVLDDAQEIKERRAQAMWPCFMDWVTALAY